MSYQYPGSRSRKGVGKRTCVATAVLSMLVAAPLYAVPKYTVNDVLVAEDQYQGESDVTPKPIFKPHETDASRLPKFWISSNEREGEAGITILKNGNNAVLSRLNIEGACIPVVNPDGSDYGCAPPGAEDHPRHPHGIDIDAEKALAYQVVEHSGLQWNADRTGFGPTDDADAESALLVVYDIRDPEAPLIREGYVLGHAAEEDTVNEMNGKVYVGNHEPSPTDVPCFVSVVDRNADAPYIFIDLPDEDCVQGMDTDESLNQVFGTTSVAGVMYAFNSEEDTVAYTVDIRGPFDDQIGGVPDGFDLTMHDLVADGDNHRAYQTIHSLAGEVDDEEVEISGRWVAEVDVDPDSRSFQGVIIIDLSNGQTAGDVPNAGDATGPFEDRFVNTHMLDVDPTRKALLVSGEHTGNLGVVDTDRRKLKQVVAISRPIPGCERVPEPGEELGPAEPHVHGVNIQDLAGTAYVSDEGEDCFYESVTTLTP